jgi:hypothetical protein
MEEGERVFVDVALIPTAAPYTQARWPRTTGYPQRIGGNRIIRETTPPPGAPRRDDLLSKRACAFCLATHSVEPMPHTTQHPAMALLCRMCQVRVETICGLIAATMTVQLRRSVSTYTVMQRFFLTIAEIEQEQRGLIAAR